MAHAQDAQLLRLREDVVTEADQHELFQSIAPRVEDGLYLVPKVDRVDVGAATRTARARASPHALAAQAKLSSVELTRLLPRRASRR